VQTKYNKGARRREKKYIKRKEKKKSFSISTLFIGKRPDLCGLSGPDGKAIIEKTKKEKKKKM
jgi:hypothetical protein